MKNSRIYRLPMVALFGAVVLCAGAQNAFACACGCSIFEVGNGALFPTGIGGKIGIEWDYMDQNQNWSGSSSASADANEDKEIRSNFLSLSGEFMFSTSWGLSVSLPYAFRSFSTLDEDTGSEVTFDHGSIGDIRINGMFTGFSSDMSTGLTFGVKLPTGDSTYANFDSDTEIGSGSTDLLLGLYHFGRISDDGKWNWFAEARSDIPLLYQNGYMPGTELDASFGLNFRGISVGDFALVPILQIAGSYRFHDTGTGDPDNSGYTRFLAVPGIDLELGSFRLLTTLGLPFYQYVTGNQLVSPVLLKIQASISF